MKKTHLYIMTGLLVGNISQAQVTQLTDARRLVGNVSNNSTGLTVVQEVSSPTTDFVAWTDSVNVVSDLGSEAGGYQDSLIGELAGYWIGSAHACAQPSESARGLDRYDFTFQADTELTFQMGGTANIVQTAGDSSLHFRVYENGSLITNQLFDESTGGGSFSYSGTLTEGNTYRVSINQIAQHINMGTEVKCSEPELSNFRYELTPTPEPSTFLLSVVAGVAFIGRRKR